MEAQASLSIEEIESCRMRDNKGRYMVWEELTVVAPNIVKGAPRRLLSRLSGYAQPGRILAIMGPSGAGKSTLLDSLADFTLGGLSGYAQAGQILAIMGPFGAGKSTLLDSLAGRLSTSVVMTGNVLVNGKNRDNHKRGISYVTQEEYFLGTLTVRETITYSAHLRLPKTMTKVEVNEVVEMTITEMGLHDCAESKIGNRYTRGLSNGEKKRLSISLEILTRPHILLLDEPSSGLDSASSFFIIHALKSIAQAGRIVACSIHQPNSDVFALLDDLFVLSSGETVYFGEAKMAAEFFADAGFPCPRRRNPSDHILHCISGGIRLSSNNLMNMTTAEIKAMLVEKYRGSKCSMVARKIQEISVIEEPDSEPNNGQNASWWKQLCTLTRRSFLNMSRDIGYYWLRIIFYMFLSLSVGTLYFDVGKNNLTIWAIEASDGFIYGFIFFLSLGGLPFFMEEIKVFYRERSNEYYGEAIFVLSNFLSSFPFLVAISLSSGTIMYYMMKFHSGFSHHAYFCINFLCFVAVTESSVMIVASLVPNLLMGVAAGAGVIVIMLMASNIFQPLPQLPKFFWRYPMSYISFASWASQGLYKNDMIGLEFDPLIPGGPQLKGEIALETMFGIKLNHSKWWDLMAVVCLLFSYKLLFFIALKYKDRALSFLQRQCANRPLLNLDRKALSRLSLSSQEVIRVQP